jgi:pyruvate formate lyase activating enzyme
LTKCRDNKIGTAIETSMYRFDRELLSLCDIIMCDIKIWDSELHKKYVGISNREILDNIRAADSIGIPMIIRTPIVPGINDTAENVKNTADFIKTLKNVQKYELLPYHPLGISKARAQGLEMQSFETPTKEKMEELRKYADIR